MPDSHATGQDARGADKQNPNRLGDTDSRLLPLALATCSLTDWRANHPGYP